MDLSPGTRIETKGFPAFAGFPGVAPERARIGRWLSYMGPRSAIPGYHPVKFEDGRTLMLHETSFRVVDNRA